MKKNFYFRSLVMLAAILSLLLTAAAPAPLASSPAAPHQAGDLVRLTVDNRTDKPLRLWLSGPAFYFLTIPAESTEVFTPLRGEYNYSLSACGITVQDTIDLSTNGRIIQPVCGSGRGQAAPAANTINMGVVAKLVKVTFTNDTNGILTLVLTGPATYVFTMAKGEETDYSVRRGDYDVHMVAYSCPLVTDTTFIARANYKKTYKCP